MCVFSIATDVFYSEKIIKNTNKFLKNILTQRINTTESTYYIIKNQKIIHYLNINSKQISFRQLIIIKALFSVISLTHFYNCIKKESRSKTNH